MTDCTVQGRPSVPEMDKYSLLPCDYEHICLGAVPLLVAIDLLAGEAFPLMSAIHKNSE